MSRLAGWGQISQQNGPPFAPLADATLFTGAVVHRVPLELPPASAGLVPELALVANHRVPDGILGPGWMLEGPSRIDRRAETGGVPGGADRRFWLDGEDLVDDGGTYRLEHDDNRVFEWITPPWEKARWEARRDGYTWTYGEQDLGGEIVGRWAVEYQSERPGSGAASHAPSPATGMASAYLLSRVVDPHGNEIRYHYTVPWDAEGDRFGGQYAYAHLISEITYANGYVQVLFEYEERPDTLIDASSGRIRLLDQRLKAIHVAMDPAGAAVDYARYEMVYLDELGEDIPEPLSGLSILKQIIRVGSDGTTKLLRALEVNADPTELQLKASMALSPTDEMDESQHTLVPLAVNFDGDPWPDLAVLALPTDGLEPKEEAHRGYHNSRVWSDVGLYEDTALTEMLNEVLNPEFIHEGNAWSFFDVDRDGATELVVATGTNSVVYEYAASTGSYYPRTDCVDLRRWHLLYGQPVDVNGDGFLDLVLQPRYDTSVPTSEVTQWIPNSGVLPYLDQHLIEDLVTPVEDVASDSYAELLVLWDSCTGSRYPPDTTVVTQAWPPQQPTGFTFEHENEYMASQARWADLNGDGVADLAYSFYPCWHNFEAVEAEGTDCVQGTPDDDAPYWPCGDLVFSRIFYGDGQGGFHDSSLLAGAPFLSYGGTSSLTPGGVYEKYGWCYDDTRSYWQLNYGPVDAAWRSYESWSVADLDRSGRQHMIHTHFWYDDCDGVFGQLRAIQDHGLPTGFGIGDYYVYGNGVWDAGWGDDCDAPELELPGHALADLWPPPHFQLLADWDADGFTDILRVYDQADVFYDWVECPDQKPTEFYVEFYENTRTVSRGRLQRIRTAWGGEIELTYAFSTRSPGPNADAAPDAVNWRFSCAGVNDALPYTVEVIRSITDEQGTRAFLFEHGEHDVSEGRFVGFRDVLVSHANGRTTHLVFASERPVQGQLTYQAEYRANGALELLSAFSYTDRTDPAPCAADLLPPYFNPMLRRCDFWLNEPVTASTLTGACCAFWAGVDNPENPLESMRPARSATAACFCGDYEIGGCLWSNPAPVFVERAGAAPAQVVEPDTPARPPRLPQPDLPPYVMYAQSWQYNSDQRLAQHVDYRDTAITEDDLATSFGYGPYNPTYAGMQLLSATQSNWAGEVLSTVERSYFDAWDRPRRITEYGRTSGGCGGPVSRERHYEYDRGDVAVETCPEGCPTAYERDAYGRVTRREDAAGRVETIAYEAEGRESRREFESSVVTTTRDGLGRVSTRTVEWGEGAPPTVETWWRDDTVDDPGGLTEPQSGVRYPDGSARLVYLDAWGRNALEATGRDMAGTGMPVLEPATAVYRFQGWAEDGSPRVVTRPFRFHEYAAGLWTYADEFGRIELRLTPAHVRTDEVTSASFLETQTLYWPGKTQTVNPLGMTTETVYDTMETAILCEGVTQRWQRTDPLGNLRRETDGDGITFVTEYDSFFRPCTRHPDHTISLYDGSSGHTPQWSYEWDLADRQTATIDPEGNRTEWSYDRIGRPTEERFYEHTDPGTAVRVMSWEYDDFEHTAWSRRKTTVTDVNGNQTLLYVDGGDRLVETILPDLTVESRGYDAMGRLAYVTDIDGVTNHYEYDPEGHLIRERGPDPAWSRSYAYDGAGDLILETDRDGVETRHAAYWSGLAAETTRGSWTLGRWTYRDDGTVETDLEGGVASSNRYDTCGRRIGRCVGAENGDCAVELTWTWSDGDRLMSFAQGGYTTHFIYNEIGWRTGVEHPDGSTESWEHDIMGRVRSHTDEESVVSEFDFNGWGRLTAERLPGQEERTFDYTNGVLYTFSTVPFYVEGTRRVEPDGRAWWTYRDFAGRVVLELRPNDTATWWERQGTRLLGILYGAAQPAPVVQARQVFGYDAHARLSWSWGPVEETRYQAAAGVPGPDDYVVHRSWTPEGRTAAVAGPNDETSYLYEQGYPVRERIKGVTETHYTYDPDYPRLQEKRVGTAPPFRTHTLAWERGLWLAQEQIVDGGRTLKHAFGDWDTYGTPRTAASEINGAPQVGYVLETDARGQVTSSVTRVHGTPFVSVSREHHRNGLVASVEVEWLDAAHTERIVWERSPAPDFHIDRVTNDTGTVYGHIAGRDEAGRPTELELADGGVVSYTYDLLGRVETQDIRTGPGGVRSTRSNSYDVRGRLESVVLHGPGGVSTNRYEYIEPGWLVRETRRAGSPLQETLTYVYDAAGNRVEKIVETTGGGAVTNSYAYAYGDRLESVDGDAITWDDFGGITQDHRGFGVRRDPTGHASAVADPASNVLYSITRDLFSRPVGVTLPGAERTQVWGNPEGPWPLAGRDEDGNPVLWVAAEGLLLARVEAGAAYQTAVDQRGSLLMSDDALLRDTGAWGDTTTTSAPGSSERYLYAGLERLPGPFMLAHHRLYDPEWGRFLSKDPLFEAGSGGSFIYANNDPLAYADPFGLSAGYWGTWAPPTGGYTDPNPPTPPDPYPTGDVGGVFPREPDLDWLWPQCDLSCEIEKWGKAYANGDAEGTGEGEGDPGSEAAQSEIDTGTMGDIYEFTLAEGEYNESILMLTPKAESATDEDQTDNPVDTESEETVRTPASNADAPGGTGSSQEVVGGGRTGTGDSGIVRSVLDWMPKGPSGWVILRDVGGSIHDYLLNELWYGRLESLPSGLDARFFAPNYLDQQRAVSYQYMLNRVPGTYRAGIRSVAGNRLLYTGSVLARYGGAAMAVFGSGWRGWQIGTGVDSLLHGDVASGLTDIGVGGTSLYLGLATAAGIAAMEWTAAELAMPAFLAGIGIWAGGETIKAAVEGRPTPVQRLESWIGIPFCTGALGFAAERVSYHTGAYQILPDEWLPDW